MPRLSRFPKPPLLHLLGKSEHLRLHQILDSQIHDTMAPQMPSSFYASSSTTPILLKFWGAKKSASNHWLQVVSESVAKRDPLQTCYKLDVQFKVESGELFITEEVKSATKVNNAVLGIVKLPFADLEEPSFEYRKETGNRILVKLSLGQGIYLSKKHYSMSVQGNWKNGAFSMLQTRQLKQQLTKTRLIEIALKHPLEPPRSIRTHILSIFNHYHAQGNLLVTADEDDNSKAAALSKIPSFNTRTISQEPSRDTIHEKGNKASRTPIQTSADVPVEELYQRSSLREDLDLATRRKEEEEEEEVEEGEADFSRAPQNDTNTLPESPGSRALDFTFIKNETEAENYLPLAERHTIEESLRVINIDGKHHVMFDFNTPAITRNLLRHTQKSVREKSTAVHKSKSEVALIDKRAKKSAKMLVPAKTQMLPEEPESLMSKKDRQEREGIRATYESFQGQNQIPLQTVGALPNRESSYDIPQQILDEHYTPADSATPWPGVLFIRTNAPKEVVRDVVDTEDQTMILRISTVSENNVQTGYMVEFRPHDGAADIFRKAQCLATNFAENWDNQPLVDELIEKSRGAEEIKLPDQSKELGKFFEEKPQLRAAWLDLLIQVAELRKRECARESRLDSLKEENERLKKHFQPPSLTQPGLLSEETLIDLSGLDFTTTVPSASPLPSILYSSPSISVCGSDDIGSSSFHTASTPHNHSNSCDMSATPGGDVDEIRHIEDAVQTVANLQRRALRAGKAVTVEVREPQEMAGWLARRSVKIDVYGDADESERKRALAVLWL